MQELTEMGLVNFSSLFLTLAMATDTDDVVSVWGRGKALVIIGLKTGY